MTDELAIKRAMQRALEAAREFLGATSPNPAVGAALLGEDGRILAVAAHERAGGPHAEPAVLEKARKNGVLHQACALVVTLEPCNHHGRTPPCTEAILAVPGLRRVVLGTTDPNPRVAGGGALRLREAGLEVVTGVLEQECRELIRSFAWHSRTGRPWVTLKTAWNDQGSMIPAPGSRTFTGPEALRRAHELRRRADAILTGSGTVLADDPGFTVRLVPDHPGKRRWLVVLDRRGQIPESWLEQAQKRGLDPLQASSLEEALDILGKRGALEVLVEAGPQLSSALLAGGLWNEHVRITQSRAPDGRLEDLIEVLERDRSGEFR
jgi:diaminohydroxyphosphoribosylaminopyrimidine deaminase/5-amino-6-(5-phosphoribosylamino)uracil reductase